MARSKKEIDKDLMYKKLMPTAQVEIDPPVAQMPLPDATISAPVVAQTAAAPVFPAATVTAKVVSDTTIPLAAPVAQGNLQSTAAALVRGTVPEPPNEIINMMEQVVDSKIDTAMAKFNCCTCDKCRRDVMAITLNKLVPCYLESTNAQKREELEAKHAGQVATAIVQAILAVKARPTHT